MQGERDVFDKIMSWPILRIFEGFYKKHKEGLLYLFFGGLAFFLSVFIFWLFHIPFGLNELIANVLSWIIVVYFAFTTNRIWVFKARAKNKSEFIRQLLSFYAGRIATLLIEEIILFLFITTMGFNSLIVKVIAQFIVIVLNYIISKLFVFKKNN